jgi:decaprenyl-phosphate phosphoribosyltransferase
MVKQIFSLLRIKDWIKNLFVFLPAFFSGLILEPNVFKASFIAFLLFSLSASLIYIINDYVDRAQDKLHPLKKDRPIASGKITPKGALIIAGILALVITILGLYSFSLLLLLPLLLYIILNLGYSFGLKHIPILDVSIIAIGFILRVVFGGLATGIFVSKWAFLLTFFLALVLALGKRRGELISISSTSRKVLDGYNKEFLNTALIICVTITIVCYVMYTISDDVIVAFGSDYIYFTTLFVIIALLRYLQLTFVYNKTESPTKVVYSDHFMQVMIALWLISFALIIYFK